MILTQIKKEVQRLEELRKSGTPPQDHVDLLSELKYCLNLSEFQERPIRFYNYKYEIFCKSCNGKAEKVKSIYTCPSCDK